MVWGCAAAQARDLTQAQILAESLLSEMTAGIYPAEPFGPMEVEPGWMASAFLQPTMHQGIVQMIVIVEETSPSRRAARYELSRWMRDPTLEIPTEPTEEASQGSAESGGAQVGSDSPPPSDSDTPPPDVGPPPPGGDAGDRNAGGRGGNARRGGDDGGRGRGGRGGGQGDMGRGRGGGNAGPGAGRGAGGGARDEAEGRLVPVEALRPVVVREQGSQDADRDNPGVVVRGLASRDAEQDNRARVPHRAVEVGNDDFDATFQIDERVHAA